MSITLKDLVNDTSCAERWLTPGAEYVDGEKLLLPKNWYQNTDMNSDVVPEDDTFPGVLSWLSDTLVCLSPRRQHNQSQQHDCLMPQQSADLIHAQQLAVSWHAARVVFTECLRVSWNAVCLSLVQHL